MPQKDCSKGFSPDSKRDPPYSGPPALPGELQRAADTEVLKQKFVYEKASVGVVWLNETIWDNSPSLGKILLKTPKLFDLDTARTILRRSYDGTTIVPDKQASSKTPVWMILSNVLSGLFTPDSQSNASTATESGPALNSAKEWLDAIQNFVDLLKDVRKNEGWFRSLWSFQEGRLLKVQAFVDRYGKAFKTGSDLDRDGKKLPFPQTQVQVDGTFKPTNHPGIRELSAFATLLAGQISLAYIKAFGYGTAAMAIPPLVELWQKLPSVSGGKATTSPLESIMSDLNSTGILYSSGDSPLELIVAARRTRFPSLYLKDQYYAMTGVLGLVKIDQSQDYSIQDREWGGYMGPRSADTIDWLQFALPKMFFEALVKRYQWLVLMLAKRSVDNIDHWGAISMGHFETINPYCENVIMKNELTVERKNWKYILPQLSYDVATDQLKMIPPAGSSATNTLQNGNVVTFVPDKEHIICRRITTNSWDGKQIMLWTLGDNAIVYQDDPLKQNGMVDSATRPPKPSNAVQQKNLTPQDLGDKAKILLISFESLGFDLVTQTKTRDVGPNKLNQRCLLLRDVIETAAGTSNTVKAPAISAYFGGIVDVSNLATEVLEVSAISLGWQATLKPATPAQSGGSAASPATNGTGI